MIEPWRFPTVTLLYGQPGCLAYDTPVYVRHGKRCGGRYITLEALFKKFNAVEGVRNPWRTEGATSIPSMRDDGSLFYNTVKGVYNSGLKNCVKITTANGNQLRLTSDHPVCVAAGEYVKSGDLCPGDVVLLKGSGKPVKSAGRKRRTVHRAEVCVKHHPVAGAKIVNGCHYKRLHQSRAVVEAAMNNLTYAAYIERLNNGLIDDLLFLPSDQEVHHRDENIRNDALDNLVVMSKVQHAQYHGKDENFHTEYVIEDTIQSVEAAGLLQTYDVEMAYPYHNFVAGGFIVHNTGKSTMARTYPEPGITFMHDPFGKSLPYLVGGIVSEEKVFMQEIWPEGGGIKYREVTHPDDGHLIWRVEYFGNPKPTQPYGAWWFRARMADFDPTPYSTIVVDSVTSYELSARKHDEYIVNFGAKDPRKHYGASKKELEEVLMMQMGAWTTVNVVTICHVDMEKEEYSGMFIRNPAVVGQLNTKIASVYSEQYFLCVVPDPDAKDGSGMRYVAQTQITPQQMAQTHIEAPRMCDPNYKAIWANWDAAHKPT